MTLCWEFERVAEISKLIGAYPSVTLAMKRIGKLRSEALTIPVCDVR